MMSFLHTFSASVAYADDSVPAPVVNFIAKINTLIINPLIILLFACALLYFLWGGLQFLMNADKMENRETGQRHMLWGIIGMFIMFAVFSIMKLIENSLYAG